jgi:outer membrane biosynthesis protein TonB
MIDPDQRALLHALRDASNPAPQREAALLERIEARAAAGDPGPDLGTAGGISAGVKLLAAAVAVAVPAIYLATQSPTPNGADRHAPVPAVAPEPTPAPAPEPIPAASPEVVPSVPVASERVVDGTAPETAAARKPASTRPTGSNKPKAARPADADDLHAELDLMQRALTAQRAGKHGRALQLLDEHARRFPHGTMVGERMLVRATSLCALGRTQQARDEADRVAKGSATKHLAPRAAKICPG